MIEMLKKAVALGGSDVFIIPGSPASPIQQAPKELSIPCYAPFSRTVL